MKIIGYFMVGLLWAGAGARVLRRQEEECVPGVQRMCEIAGGVRFCCRAEMRCGMIVDQCIIRPERTGTAEKDAERVVVVETKAETKDESKDQPKVESKAEANLTPSSTPSSTSSSTHTTAALPSKSAPTTISSQTSTTSSETTPSPSTEAEEPFLTSTRLIIISISGGLLLLLSLALTLYLLHRRRKHLDFEGPASAPHSTASTKPPTISPPPFSPCAPPAYRSETPESPSASGAAEEAIGPLDGMVGGRVGMAESVGWPTTVPMGAGRGYVKEHQSGRGRGGRRHIVSTVVTVTPPRPPRG